MSFLYLTVNFKITAIIVGMISGCPPPIRGDFVIVQRVVCISGGKNTLFIYGISDWCQVCVRCIEGVGILESPLWEVPL